METINIKEEARSLIARLPENFTWYDLISAIYLRQRMQSQTIHIQGIKPEIEPETLDDEVAESSPKRSRFGSVRGLITTSDDFDEPLELLPSPLVDRLLKAKELRGVSAQLDEIIAKIEK